MQMIILLAISLVAAVALGVGLRLRDMKQEREECLKREREYFATLSKKEKKEFLKLGPLVVAENVSPRANVLSFPKGF